jgi:hypothetical protein
MIVFLNRLALLFGLGSAAIALVTSAAFGWITFVKDKPSPHENYAAFLWGGLLVAIDFVWRLRKVGSVKVPDAPRIITRQGPVAKKPAPMTKLLNVLLSGDYGAQFFWIFPGWLAGAILIWLGRR